MLGLAEIVLRLVDRIFGFFGIEARFRRLQVQVKKEKAVLKSETQALTDKYKDIDEEVMDEKTDLIDRLNRR